MHTSPAGIAALKTEEGTVLQAYLCPAGVWTIGNGFTAGGGIIKPYRGMTITQRECDRLLVEHLRKVYEPRVRRQGHATLQHEFDASVSFDFNTGRIHNASWVGLFRADQKAAARKSFMQWVKPKILKPRRQREAAMLFEGIYPHSTNQVARKLEIFEAGVKLLAKLKLIKGTETRAEIKAAVLQFQTHHPNLANDGILGPATLASLQRAVRARKEAKAVVATGAGGAAATSAAEGAQTIALQPWVLGGLGAVALLLLGYVAWRNRYEILHFMRGL